MDPENDSVFTKIIKRELPAKIHYEDDNLIIIESIEPKAKIHLLGITKRPFKEIDQLLQNPDNKELLWELFEKLSRVAHNLNIDKSGYRLTTNIGQNGGQMVEHLHVHLLGGEKLSI